ncbi:MAG: 30S ribosomal protein S9 [bacterium]|nr:30S ribosomal protein S9 [bacterium]
MAEKKTIVRFFQAKGGRKSANASARVFAGKGLTVNNKDYKEYFKTSLRNQLTALLPFEISDLKTRVGASVMVHGGGINAQADAVKNAVARAMVKFEPDLRKLLKPAGYLTRDSRIVERKKYGLLKARRAPQWAKR